MLLPSKAAPRSGPGGVGAQHRAGTSQSLVTLLLPKFVTQMLLPSKTTQVGVAPTAICVTVGGGGRVQVRTAFWLEL